MKLLPRVNHTQLQLEGKQWKEIKLTKNRFQVRLATYCLVYLGSCDDKLPLTFHLVLLPWSYFPHTQKAIFIMRVPKRTIYYKKRLQRIILDFYYIYYFMIIVD
jgi:hypothetical protein